MVNQVLLLGRLGKDPELRPVGSTKVCSFSLATSERRKATEDKPAVDHTEWHNIVVWGNLAETCAKYLKKGRRVYVDGKITTRNWEKEGVKHYRTEIMAKSVQFLDGDSVDKKEGQSAQKQQHTDDWDNIPFA
jgi:single-strand DNA-binding protein